MLYCNATHAYYPGKWDELNIVKLLYRDKVDDS